MTRKGLTTGALAYLAASIGSFIGAMVLGSGIWYPALILISGTLLGVFCTLWVFRDIANTELVSKAINQLDKLNDAEHKVE